MGYGAQVQQPQTSGGKGGPVAETVPTVAPPPKPVDRVDSGYSSQVPRPMGKGGAQTNSATSGQPTVGAPNQYSNTVGQWDNTQQQPMSHQGGGKGKG